MTSCVVARLSVCNSITWMFSRTYLTCPAMRHFVRFQYFSMKVKPPPPLLDHNGVESNSNSHFFEELAPSDGPHCETKGSNSVKKVRKFQEKKHISPMITARGPPSPWKKSNRKGLYQSNRGNTEEFNNLRDNDFQMAHTRSQKPLVRPMISKGSEILFGVAPCYLAISQSRRKSLNLFLKSTLTPRRPVIMNILSQAEAHGVPVQYVKRKMLDSLCNDRVHQGVCMEVTPLLCKRFDNAEDLAECGDVCPEKQQVWLVLEGIHDPMNMGAVLRTAYFLGVNKVVKSQTNSCPLTPVVSKASAGTMELLETFETDDLLGFLQAKSQQGWQVVGTVGNADAIENTPITTTAEFEWRKPLILVLGNEGKGLSTEIRSACQMMLTIPSGRNLPPGIESLNVSVAAGIILHSLCLKRTQ